MKTSTPDIHKAVARKGTAAFKVPAHSAGSSAEQGGAGGGLRGSSDLLQ